MGSEVLVFIVHTRRNSNGAVIVQSCVLDILSRYPNLIAGKGFNCFKLLQDV